MINYYSLTILLSLLRRNTNDRATSLVINKWQRCD